VLTESQIASSLDKTHPDGPVNLFPPSFFNAPPTPAGILMPLFPKNGGWHLVYIRRTEKDGDYHSGQVAFPGGAREPSDADIRSAALREASEEIGLNPQDVSILGRIQEVHTISNFIVTPFVGLIPWPYKFSLSKEEVVKQFSIPLDWLADPANHSTRTRSVPGLDRPHPVIFFEPYEGEVLWGLSAYLTLQFINQVLD